MVDEKTFVALRFMPGQRRGQRLNFWFIIGQGGPIRVDFHPADHRQALETLRQWGGVMVRARTAGPLLTEAVELLHHRLSAYLEGKSRHFYPIVPPSPFLAAGSAFQQRVWREIGAIPYGSTQSYGELGERLGGRGLARAVGQACGANPCPLLIPCHRVVGAASSGGFGGGLALKKWLLALEEGRSSVHQGRQPSA